MAKQSKPDLRVIGWREWVGLPDLGIKKIKAKVDTGARSSSLHAFDLHQFEKEGVKWVRFKFHPLQRTAKRTIEASAEILEYRSVRSSSGAAQLRPVIVTQVELLGIRWPVELTLANRDEMGFRMLLGREAFRKRFLVDAGNSFFGGQPKRKKKLKSKSQSKQRPAVNHTTSEQR
jgi:hypothetical protein